MNNQERFEVPSFTWNGIKEEMEKKKKNVIGLEVENVSENDKRRALCRYKHNRC